MQTFVNPSKKDVIEDAKYNFPLYESSAVVAFRCFVQDRLIEGVVKGKEEAKETYQEAIEQGEVAGLLEQFSPDVFRTSLGNIPAGASVKVEVEYIMELKHDAEVDGLRFTIPTSIAPRYGEAPFGLATSSSTSKGGMKISVQITMPSNIRSVQSPSHPIVIHLGGHVENIDDDAFNPKHALATLSQTSTELGSDFILLVRCADISSPRAILETHSTKPASKALVITLVPKFTLPPGPKPEIVFVVDRSGSMASRMVPLISSLTVFLKSLPVGIRFNICSFGSSHTFLWKTSRPYSANTLEEAQRHVQSMSANMGGTEILAPIKASISRRFKDLPLEVMVLTDGEVWNTGPLFEMIEKETAKGDVRVFSLGIGRDVSHSLVEGMARVGKGFAQILSDEKEGMEGKVVRMLRGGLSAHVNDYRLEWDNRPAEEETQQPTKKRVSQQRPKRKINLFDVAADTDAPISKAGGDRFSHLPEFNIPTVLQAPYKLPPLFPFSRYTVYTLLTGDVPPPTSVWLRGTTSSGDELELEIPVQILAEKAPTLHQLAARKLLQELEEGTSYLHSGNYGVSKEDSPGAFGDWVEREGMRLGVEYGLASKWTSFVAVQKKRKEGMLARTEDDPDLHDLVLVDSEFTTDDEDLDLGSGPKDVSFTLLKQKESIASQARHPRARSKRGDTGRARGGGLAPPPVVTVELQTKQILMPPSGSGVRRHSIVSSAAKRKSAITQQQQSAAMTSGSMAISSLFDRDRTRDFGGGMNPTERRRSRKVSSASLNFTLVTMLINLSGHAYD